MIESIVEHPVKKDTFPCLVINIQCQAVGIRCNAENITVLYGEFASNYIPGTTLYKRDALF